MKKVAAVIVTFNNCGMLARLLESVAEQTRPPDKIFLIDNASTDDTETMLGARFPGITHIRLEENQGTAGGYHEGLRTALKDHDFVWTLDDDVILPADSLEKLMEGLAGLNSQGKIAAVRSVGWAKPHSSPIEMEGYTWRGTLFNGEALKSAGLPDKRYFIYGEDLELSLRLAMKGYSFFWIPSSGCLEAREGKRVGFFLGKPIKIYSDAFRLYYAIRNELHICLRYRRPRRLLRTCIYALKLVVYFVISDRFGARKEVGAILSGFIDGFSGKLGKNRRYLPGS